MGATIACNVVSWVLKKIFSGEIDKNDIYLGVQGNKMLFFRKFALKNALIPPRSRIGPGLKSDSHLPKKFGWFASLKAL